MADHAMLLVFMVVHVRLLLAGLLTRVYGGPRREARVSGWSSSSRCLQWLVFRAWPAHPGEYITKQAKVLSARLARPAHPGERAEQST